MQKIISFFAIGLLALASPLIAAPEIGESAPDFTLTDTNGKSHSLGDFRGKYVVLEWVNHGCPFVKKFYEPGKMQALQKRFTDDGVVWLSINSSREGQQGNMSAEDWNRAAKEKNKAATAILLDGDFAVARAYGARVTPHMFVIDPEGKLIYNGAIDSIRSANSADIEKAENYVVQVLEARRNGQSIDRPVTQPYGCAIRF
jgi:peroxiredoxin